MENYVAAQLQQLGAAAALGGAAGLVYDVLRSARLLDRRDRRRCWARDCCGWRWWWGRASCGCTW